MNKKYLIFFNLLLTLLFAENSIDPQIQQSETPVTSSILNESTEATTTATEVATTRSDVVKMEEKIVKIAKQVVGVEDQVVGFENQLLTVEHQVNEVKNQMDSMQYSGSSVNDRLDCLESIHMPPECFEPTDICERGVFHVEGEFLYWKFVNDGMPMGVYGAEPSPIPLAGFHNNFSLVNITFDYDPGFRIDAGYTLPYFWGWDLFSSWTRLHSKNSRSVTSDSTNNIFFPYWYFIPDLYTDAPINASADMKINYDAWDLMLGRMFTLYSVFAFEPMIGMQISWVDQKQEMIVNGFNPNDNPPTPITEAISTKNRFKGIGIKAGSDLRMILGYGFEIFGDFFLTLYASTFKLRVHDVQITGTAPAGSNALANYKEKLPCTELEMNIGLKWGTYFYNQAYLSLFTGYEMRNVINFNQLKELVLIPQISGGGAPLAGFPFARIHRQSGDLLLHGLTVGGKLFF